MFVATIGTSVSLVQIPWFAEHLSLAPLHRDDWVIAVCGGFLSVAGPVILFGALARLTRLSKTAFALFRSRRAAAADSRTVEGTVSTPPLTRYAWLSILAAVVTMAMKAAAYLLTGSVALLSDAAESVVNLVSAAFALIILGVASRPADETHPFGHGRAEYFSSGFEGALILVAASGIFWTAWGRLMHPQPLGELDVGMVVASIAALVNFLVARILLNAGRRYHSITLEADGKHLMTDVWTTGAVLVGLVGVALTDWLWLDPVIAMLAAVNIVGAGAQLILRSLSGLIGAAIPAAERAEVECILDGYRQQGIQFHDLRARVAGTQRLMTFHVLVPGTLTVKEGHDLVQAIENDIGKILPNLIIVTHLEPLDDPSSFEHEIVPDVRCCAERSK
jgi:cation diffusion facilitator family transporter